MVKPLTQEQLIKEFREALNRPRRDSNKEPYTWTAPEVQDLYKVSRRKAREVLRRLVSEQILYPAKVWRVNEWGEERPYPGYKLCDHLTPKEEQHE